MLQTASTTNQLQPFETPPFPIFVTHAEAAPKPRAGRTSFFGECVGHRCGCPDGVYSVVDASTRRQNSIPEYGPAEQYLMERGAEIALALSAVPKASRAMRGQELPAVGSGAMCYMMSKQGYLSDRDGHWHPHLMFFLPLAEPATWGANLANSPIIGSQAAEDRLTVFLVPVAKWLDGTPATTDKTGEMHKTGEMDKTD